MARMACIAILLLASTLLSSHAIRVPGRIRCPYHDPHFDEPFHRPCRPWGPGTNRLPISVPDTSAPPSPSTTAVSKSLNQGVGEELPFPPVDSESPAASQDSDPEMLLKEMPDPFGDEPTIIISSAPAPASQTEPSRFGSSKFLWWPWGNTNLPDPLFDEPYNPPVKGSSASAPAPSDETESSRYGSSKRMLWWPWDSINWPGLFPPVKGSSTSAPAPSDETESSRFGSSKFLWWPWDNTNLPDPLFDEPYNPPVEGSSSSAPAPSDETESSRFGSSKRMLWWPWDSINRPRPFPPVKGSSASAPSDETESSRFGSSKFLWWPWDDTNLPDPLFDEPYNPPVEGSSESAPAPSDETESSRFGSSKRMLWWPWDSINRPRPFPPVKGSSASAPSDETESSRFGSSKFLWWPWDDTNLPDPFFDEPYNPPMKDKHA